jgi:hypothetical protein
VAFLAAVLAVATVFNLLNVLIMRARTRRHALRDPSLALGYQRIILGFVVLSELPWLIALAVVGILGGTIFTGLWSGAVTVWVIFAYWVFAKGGAEMLVSHPGILNFTPSNPTWVKVAAIVAPLFLGVFFLIAFSGI